MGYRTDSSAGFVFSAWFDSAVPDFCPTDCGANWRRFTLLSCHIFPIPSADSEDIQLMFCVPLYFQLTQRASSAEAGAHLNPAITGNAVAGSLCGGRGGGGAGPAGGRRGGDGGRAAGTAS